MSTTLKTQLMSLIFLVSIQSLAANNLDKKLSCYRALISHSKGANYDLGNGSILIPGSKGSSHGFYIYTDQTAYFCGFPNSPAESNTQYNYYYFKLEIPSKSVVTMTYSDEKSNPSNPGLGISHSLDETSSGKYVVPKCVAYLTDESRAVLNSELKKRISTVKSNVEIHTKYSGVISSPEKYQKALNTCVDAGGEVGQSASTELTKFSSAAPAVKKQPGTTEKAQQ